MKRFLLFLAACCFGIAITNAQVERKVMIEQFTNASCGPCAAQNPAFNALLEPNEDRVIALKYQWYFPGFDPMHEQNPTEVNTRIGYYGINGVPTAAIDGTVPGNSYGGGVGDWNITPQGGYAGGPYGYNQAVLDYAKGIPTNISMELNHSVSVKLDSVSITCKVTNEGNTAFNPADGRLFIAITEEDITFQSPPGSNGEREFSHVMRKMVPGVQGTNISSIPANDFVEFTFNYPLPTYIYDYSEIGVVAFVQDFATGEMFQAERSVKQGLPAGGSYARISLEDRTVVAEVPCEQSVNPKVLVRNTLNTALTSFTASYSISGGTPVTMDWTGNLEQDQLVVVNFGDVTLPNAGTYGISYEISNFNNDPDVIVIDPAANLLTSSAVITSLPSDPIGTESTYDLESEEVYSYPDNAATSHIDGIARTFQTVDASVFNQTDAIGGFGQSDKAMLIDFFDWDPAITGVPQATLTLAKVDLSSFTEAYFKMDRAYARFPGALDRLQILVSTDCGDSWTVVANRAGGGFATAPTQQTAFTPTAEQWETDVFDISEYAGQEVTFGLRAFSGRGNRAYLDNIQIAGGVFTSTSTINLLSGKVNVFPNPTNQGTPANVEFELVESSAVDIDIYDLSGKHVAQLMKGKTFGVGSHIATWNNVAERGMYLVKIKTAYGELTQKLTVF